jgi:hypothetical protein
MKTSNVDHLIAVCEQRAAEEKAYWEWAPGHSEQRARCDRDRELSKRDYQLVRDIRRAEKRNFTLFTIEIPFCDLNSPNFPPSKQKHPDPWTRAMMARRELIAAGYEFVIRPAIDDCSNAVFVEVSRSTCAGLDEEVLWKQVEEIVEPFGGDVDCGGLIEDLLKERQLHRLH